MAIFSGNRSQAFSGTGSLFDFTITDFTFGSHYHLTVTVDDVEVDYGLDYIVDYSGADPVVTFIETAPPFGVENVVVERNVKLDAMGDTGWEGGYHSRGTNIVDQLVEALQEMQTDIVTALAGGGGGGGGGDLGDLDDVSIELVVADNEVLAYDTTFSRWVNQTAAEAGLLALSGGVMSGDIDMGGNDITTGAGTVDGVDVSGHTHDGTADDGGVVDHTDLTSVGSNAHSVIDTHLGSTSNPHSVTAAQAGADAAGTAAAGDSAHLSAYNHASYDSHLGSTSNPHSVDTGDLDLEGYLDGLADIGSGGASGDWLWLYDTTAGGAVKINFNKFATAAHAAAHSDGGSDEITLEDLATAAASGLGWISDGAGGIVATTGKVAEYTGAIPAVGVHVTDGVTGPQWLSLSSGYAPAMTGSAVTAVSRGGFDTDAVHTNVAGEYNAGTNKATPVAADVLYLEDSAASYAKKKVGAKNLYKAVNPTSSTFINRNSVGNIVETAVVAESYVVGGSTGALTTKTRVETRQALRPIVKYYETAGPASLNTASWTDLDWDSDDITQGEFTGGFIHTTADEIEVDFDGIVRVTFNVGMTSTVQRPSVKFRVAINGTGGRGEFKTGYIRASTSTHDESSCGGTETFSVSDGDIITIQHMQEAVAGTVTINPTNGAYVEVERIH